MSSLTGFVKRIRDIMWNDAGVNGDAQRIEQMAWILFLKVYNTKEEEWRYTDRPYTSIIPEECRWNNWAADDKSGKAMTGDTLLDFVNNKLFPTLKGLNVTAATPIKKAIVKTTFEDANNYMKDGVLLRQVINIIDDLDLDDYEESHAFGEIYESILRELQSAGSSGEFYTPRAVTDFMAKTIKPKLGEKVADFACGTGGFLTSWLNELSKQVVTAEDQQEYATSIYGIEKKPFPYTLCITNMLLHGIDVPMVYHDNSLLRDVLDYTEEDQFDVVLMNPPYGGHEKTEVKNHFPADLASSETADLFMSVIMYRLKQNAVPLSFSPMVSCSALIMQRLQLRKNCYLNLTFTLLYACRIAFLHRTPLSRQIFCSSIGRIPRRKLGSTAWICRKDIRTSPRRSP